MALVTSDFLQAMFTNFNVIWEGAFLAAARMAKWQRYVMETTSNTDNETYAWLGTVPQMREWLDIRQLSSLTAFNYTIQNRKFESTVEVRAETIKDDKYGMIRPRIAQLGQEAARYPGVLAAQTLANGNTTLAYDGSNYFATTHNEGITGNQSNLVTGSGTTLPQVRADFITARAAMRRFKDDQGRPMNLAPDLVVIPPEMQDVFEQLINTNMIALASGTQQSNVLMGAVDIMVDANLTDPNDWYLLDTQEIIKPLIYQIREPMKFESVDNPTDMQVFMRDRYLYGVAGRFNLGYGLWQMALRVTN